MRPIGGFPFSSQTLSVVGAMDLSSSETVRPRRGETVDRLGGSLMNLVLGALILWVGQTTFRHAGLLASVNERFESVGLQFSAVDARHETMRERLAQVTSETTERTRSRFTREDGDKMAQRLKEIHAMHSSLERQLVDRVTRLQLKVIALETHGSDSHEISRLRSEVQRLHTEVARQQAGRHVATGGPTYLPPVTSRR